MGIPDVALAGAGGAIRNPAEVFGEIFWVFLGLGTAVGVVVIGYTLYNSYKYREGADHETKSDVDRPELGELPSGSGGGKKLALSFSISAIIVIGLIIWTYSTLLYIEDPPDTENAIEIQVEGQQFGWVFEYPNGEQSPTLHAPADRLVWLNVTSRDVFHNFGIPELRTKTDAIPGQMSRTWFLADEPGEHTAVCYELCGSGHSRMTAPVVIHDNESFQEWYASTSPSGNQSDGEAGMDGNETAAIGPTTTTGAVAAGDSP